VEQPTDYSTCIKERNVLSVDFRLHCDSDSYIVCKRHSTRVAKQIKLAKDNDIREKLAFHQNLCERLYLYVYSEASLRCQSLL